MTDMKVFIPIIIAFPLASTLSLIVVTWLAILIGALVGIVIDFAISEYEDL